MLNKALLIVPSVLFVFCVLLFVLQQAVVSGLNGGIIEHPIETREIILLNGGKFLTETTPIEETGWGGDSYDEKEFFYQPPGVDRLEFVGRGRGHGIARSHVDGDRIMITHKNTLFMRSSEGNWQEINWTYHSFPGRESQSARSVLDRHPNHKGYFKIISVAPSLDVLAVEYHGTESIYVFKYAVRDDQGGIDLIEVATVEPPKNDLDASESDVDAVLSTP